MCKNLSERRRITLILQVEEKKRIDKIDLRSMYKCLGQGDEIDIHAYPNKQKKASVMTFITQLKSSDTCYMSLPR